MGALDGRVVVVTGAGNGLGRSHALLLASEGAKVVVNDVEELAAATVVEEICAAGGEAVDVVADIAEWDTGQRLVDVAVGAFGGLDVLVNNAGFIRDRALVNMTEDEWDSVLRVHLKGHFVPTRFAAAWWREQHKAGNPVRASVINTTSTSGLHGNPGQVNYGAAKAGIASLTMILAEELSRYGVRVNAIAPSLARTRLTQMVPGLSELVAAPGGDGFDPFDPANLSPIVAYLATAEATETGQVFYVTGDQVRRYQPWALDSSIEAQGPWTVEQLVELMPMFRGAPLR
jgi:NAD(P)-dependent dehydrogenase (short-subunit alcohol dehydrogenase family)